MKSKITFLLMIICLSAKISHAQNREYPKPGERQQIPFGQKLPPPSLNEVQKYLPSASSYPLLKPDNSPPPLTMPDRLGQETLQSLNITTNGDRGGHSNFHLTKDINARSESDPQNFNYYSYPFEKFAVLNDVSYFFADDGKHGFELWRSDATRSGTYLVKDINPGEASAGLNGNISIAGGKVYFPATTAENGLEPWVSDGTAAGTHSLVDINPGPDGSSPGQFVTVNNMVFFIANNNQVWKTDGTTAGTVLVQDIASAGLGFQILQATSANGLLFFTANSFFYGRQLWRSDGTAPGTDVVKPIGFFLDDNSGPLQLTEYDHRLYFSVNDGTGRRLWVSDGTFDGTNYATGNNNVFMQTDFLSQNNRNPFPVINNILYLAAMTDAEGSGLYKFDKTNNDGVVLVKDLAAGTDIDFISPIDFAVVNNRLYFKVVNSTGGYHDELWKSDGNAFTTRLIRSFLSGENTFDYNNGNGLLFFNVADAVHGNELWKSNGTEQGTKLVKDIWRGTVSSAPYYLTECNGKLLFNGADNNKGASLYVSDGTEDGTRLLKDINTTTTSSSNAGGNLPGEIGTLRNSIVFSAFERGHGIELYNSDGELVKDIFQGEAPSYPNAFISKNGYVYFRANNTNFDQGFAGSTIYKTDGTPGGTRKLVDVNGNYFLGYNVANNGIVYYTIFSLTTFNYELWRTDGTAGGTYLLTSGLFSSPYIVTAGNKAFFIAGDFASGFELWKSDGTVAGTALVKDIYPGPGGSDLYSLFAYKNDVYFGAYDGTGFYYSFWKSDGTEAGTIKLKDLTPARGTNNAEISQFFCVSDNTLFFNAVDPAAFPYQGFELYSTNGRASNTKLVKDINPYYDSYPINMRDVDGRLFFTADDGVNGRELWKSNGTANSTKLVKDIMPGPGSSNIGALTSVGEKAFFLSDLNTNYVSLWSSDGTADDTGPLTGGGLTGLSWFRNPTGTKDKLFFGAYSYKYGSEMYVGEFGDDHDGHNDRDSYTSTQNKVMVAPPQVELDRQPFDAVVYPNPSRGITTLQLSGKAREVSISITDLSGKLVWQSSYSNRTQITLPTEKFTAGVYLITVKSGAENRNIKLVIQ